MCVYVCSHTCVHIIIHICILKSISIYIRTGCDKDFAFLMHILKTPSQRRYLLQTIVRRKDFRANILAGLFQRRNYLKFCPDPLSQAFFQNDALSQVMLWPYLPRGSARPDVEKLKKTPKRLTGAISFRRAASSFCGFNLWSDFNV